MYGHNIAQAAEQRRQGAIRDAAGTCIGGVGAEAPVRAETEIEREVERLRRADNEMSEAIEMLWDRMGRAGVLAPPPETTPGPGLAVETAHSALGAELQNRAFAVQSKAERLHELMRCLCL